MDRSNAETVRPVILCGGSGTRLWPLSTPTQPKQFRALVGPASMLSQTAHRVSPGASAHAAGLSFSTPLVVGSLKHRDLIVRSIPDADCLLEPVGRNSAPAIAASVLAAHPDTLLLVLPADHHIENVGAFHHAISEGTKACRARDAIVTFGIKPDHPATGYGYIEIEPGDAPAKLVRRFVEKPDEQTARRYLSAGNFYWNAGIFLFRAGRMVSALEQLTPELIEAVRRARTDDGRLSYDAFKSCESVSIDYAVMEPLGEIGSIAVVPVNMGWSDIGDYAALHAVRTKSARAGRPDGAAHALDAEGCLIVSEGPMVSAIGVRNLAIVARPDAVLVTDLGRSQDVKSAAALASWYGAGFAIEDSVRHRCRAWLLDEVMPFWAAHGWDAERGGFKEALNLDDPRREALEFRRMRVQARQIYCFSHAKLLGWQGPADGLISDGLEYLFRTAWREDRGFAHKLDRSGQITDPRTDTYDQAFALTALSWAHRAGAGGDLEARADRLADLLDARLSDPHGGYLDDDTGSDRRRANPHMHLLEAFIAAYEAFAAPHWIERATSMVELFEDRFFDTRNDRVIEHLTPDWLPHPEQGERTEPGHGYEWASLLARLERHTGRDLASWRRRLIASADRRGRDPRTGFAFNEVSAQGKVLDASRRLWPQTEMLRARIVEPASAPPGEAERLIAALMDTYLVDSGPGRWMDLYDGEGNPAAVDIPASTLYHLLSGFAPVLDGRVA